MFTHMIVGATDLAASKTFYDAALGALGHKPGHMMAPIGRVMYPSREGTFGVTLPINGEPATQANGATIGFAAANEEAVLAFHKAGVEAGGTSIEDAPGLRQTPFGDLSLAYLRDPAGNKICAMYRAG